MIATVSIGGRQVPVHGARTGSVLHSGDVVELRLQQEAGLLSWFAPGPLEAAEGVAQAFAVDLLTIPDERRPDVRGWVLAVESVRGFEEDDEVFVDVRMRVVAFDSRPPELIEPEELQAGLGLVQVLVTLGLVLGIVVGVSYVAHELRVFAAETKLVGSGFGFGFLDAVIAVAAAAVLIAWFKKGRAHG